MDEPEILSWEDYKKAVGFAERLKIGQANLEKENFEYKGVIYKEAHTTPIAQVAEVFKSGNKFYQLIIFDEQENYLVVYARKIYHRIDVPCRTVYSFDISDDYGKSWQSFALCEDCYHALEPPTMAKKGNVAGVKNCDFCGCRNVS